MGHPFHTLLVVLLSLLTPSLRMEEGQNAYPCHLCPVSSAWSSSCVPPIQGMARDP